MGNGCLRLLQVPADPRRTPLLMQWLSSILRKILVESEEDVNTYRVVFKHTSGEVA